MSLEQYERVLEVADRRARSYLAGVDARPVAEQASVGELRKSLDRKLPDQGEDPAKVVEELADAAEPGLIALASPRYFGFVIGGTLPAALGADWLAGAWDQIASLYVCGPSAAVAEEVSGRWVLEVLGLPTDAGFGLTTGGTMANFSGIAAGRHAVLRRAGWDVEAKGLSGAPEVRVLVGEHAHATIFVALRLLGLGSENAIRVRADDAGRMDPEALAAELDRGEGPAIVCAQAGEVNTGCFDPFPAIAEICERHGAWLHVDGAVGLWAASSPRVRLPDRGARPGRLLVDRRPQVAQRHLRLRLHRRQGRGRPARSDGDQRPLPEGGGGRPRLLPVRPRVLAPRSWLRSLRGTPLAGPEGGGGSGRALLLPGTPDGGRARAGSGDRGDQRRGHQPGAGRAW